AVRVDPLPDLVQPARRAGPDDGGDEGGDPHEGQDRLHVNGDGSGAVTSLVPTVTELSPTAPADAQLDRRRPQVEGLAQLALEVAQVGPGQLAVGEQREGGRLGGPLRGVEDP